MEDIRKEKYRNLIITARKTARIVVISGLHGSGKSVMLEETARAIREERPPVRIVRIDGGTDAAIGRELIQAARALGVGPSALFIDEADAIDGIAEALQAILANHAATVFATGRNSKRLENALIPAFGPDATNELAVVRMDPLTYGEFLSATGIAESRAALDLYCKTGGLPQSLMVSPESPEADEFSRMRANSFILTEIVERHSIRNPVQLRALLALAARSTGESLPAREVCEAFRAERVTISPQAALDYLSFCADAGILVPVPTFDLSKGRIADSCDVWYFGDVGLRAAFVTRRSAADLSRAEENLAYLRLVADGWTVWHGKIGSSGKSKEDITFVCERGGKRIYIQVIANGATSGARLRKRAALLAIRDAWPRYLVDADEGEDLKDGIGRLYIRDFLASGIR